MRQYFPNPPIFFYIFTGANILGLFKLGMILLLGIVFVYFIVINDCVMYIIIIINDLS